jgi:5-methylcytosine-specific restriction endonuclease McrA
MPSSTTSCAVPALIRGRVFARGIARSAVAWETLGMTPRRFGSSSRVALFLAARGRCAECGAPLRPGWHADHVTPVRVGGESDAANGRALCPRCNLRKGGRVP